MAKTSPGPGARTPTTRKVSLPVRIRRRIRFARNIRRSMRLSTIIPTPARPEPLDAFAMFAIVMARDEDDVIADSVANAFAQGADRVLLIDHHSVDATVEQAVRNGAEHIATFEHEPYDEQARMALMNSIVDEVSAASEHDHIWWLWFDADEFTRPVQGGTIRQTLEQLDRRIRLVGARSINHYPTPGQPVHVPGVHPASYQLLAHEYDIAYCRRRHRKHPLQRWDRGAEPVRALIGFHSASCSTGPIPEADLDLVIHHIEWRDRAANERRLATDGRLTTGGQYRSFVARMASIEAVYDHDWANVSNYHPLARGPGVEVRDWRELEPRIAPDLPTWTLRDASPTDHAPITD